MTNHTPGPWLNCQAVGQRLSSRRIISDSNKISTVVADVPDYGKTSASERHANARLIAAAPDLLKALIDARQGLKNEREILFESVRNFVSGTIDDPQDSEEVGLLDSRINYVDCVIAKATGESA